MGHLDVPNGGGTPQQQKDFATGYALGMVGGVRNWMRRSRRTLNDDAPGGLRDDSGDSDDASIVSPARSPVLGHEETRGRPVGGGARGWHYRYTLCQRTVLFVALCAPKNGHRPVGRDPNESCIFVGFRETTAFE